MKRFVLLSVSSLIFVTAGCAELVTKTYKPYRGGTVKYSKTMFITDKNRDKALELAADYCRPGRVDILSEDSKMEFTGHTMTSGKISGNDVSSESTQSQSSNVYIHFSCKK